MTSTVVVAISAVTLALMMLGASAAALLVYLRREFQSERPAGNLMEEHGVRIAQLEVMVEGFPSLWEEERKRAKRDADSARKSRSVAEEKLAEVEELIQAGSEFPGGDAAVVDQLEMQPLHPRLGDPPASDRRERLEAVAHLLR